MRDLPSLLLATSETEVFCLISFFFPKFMFLRLIFIGVQLLSLPSGSDGKESACNAGDLGCAPGLGRSPGEGNGHPVQRSCLGKSLLGCKKLGVVALQVHVSFDSMAVNQSQVHTCPLPSGLASNLGDYSA